MINNFSTENFIKLFYWLILIDVYNYKRKIKSKITRYEKQRQQTKNSTN